MTPPHPALAPLLAVLAAEREAAEERRLLAAARRWREGLAGRLPPAERVEVWVAGRLAAPPELELLAWSLLTGAAVVLPGEPEQRASVAAWVRPTVFTGTAREVAELLTAARAAGSFGAWRSLRRLAGRSDLPLGRLHTVLVTGRTPLTAAVREALEERQVCLSHVEFLVP